MSTDTSIIDWSFLPSQRAFLPSAQSYEKFRAISAGFRSGKSTALCRAAVLLSHTVPDNLGFLGRASGKDMETTLYETFFNEVCPPSLILDVKKVGQTGRNVILQSTDPRRPSRIYMDYIIDRSSGKSHVAGMNLGWFGISQAEETSRDDFHKLVGRLSRNVPRTFGLLEDNLQGHNWIYEDFYAGGDYTFGLNDSRTMFKAVRKPGRIGIVARSEENRKSFGGFVNDDYFDELRRTYPPEWIARQLDGSFDDFSGKIFTGFNLDSIHNIQPFKIPDHWGWLVSIDPGGSDPTGIGVFRIDTEGNMICVDEFYRPNVNPHTITEWIRSHVPVNEAKFVIDYENRLFTIHLQDEFGILCEPAFKDHYASAQQAASYFWTAPARKLPMWYRETQPLELVQRFDKQGAPRIYFVGDSCPNVRRSCNNYVWDEKRPNKIKETQDDHGGDLVRYACSANPRAAERNADESLAWRMQHDPLRHLMSDPASYDSARNMQKMLQRAQRAQKGGPVDWSSDGLYQPSEDDGQVRVISEFL